MRILIAARSTFSVLAFAVLVMTPAVGMSSAWANPAGREIADRFVDLLTSYDAKNVRYADANYDSASDVTTIYGFSLDNPKERSSLLVQDIQMTGVQLYDSGGLSADELLANEIRIEGSNSRERMSVRQITILNPVFPEKEVAEGENNTFIYRLASGIMIEDIVFQNEGMNVPIAAIYAGRGSLDGDIPEMMNFSVENMIIQTAEIEDREAAANLEKFGYEEINFSFSSFWSWDSSAEQAVIGPVSFFVEDMGNIMIQLSLGGVSRELIQSVGDKDRMMGLAQLLTLKSAYYQLEDDSITDRVISITAKEGDLSPSTLTGLWVDLARQQMQEMNLPEDFVTMVVKAFESFLTDPGTLAIAAEPQTPVLFSQLMGSVMFGPAAIIPLLNFTVTAE
jgi:hypothetical protein